ncbi:recombinase family protein [Aliiroseovarius sp. KMU-50]|uniref:Recombinase family protein n=1 Tax=Aliiroseovarius salicola TaxID=3009082 RepID=A0ABT4W3C2_9RHOB|nr:recombinase family protein [Aliiroseovarius sp. KMU-50]MDA5095010.1 recombinase family protein [Aliiroseovarius sp. KMU-50]
MPLHFISYYRVSTARQGESGLGLDAQRLAALKHCEWSGGRIVEEFIEVESGKRMNRRELTSALESCRKTGATLLIARLDRLARSVHFISGLLESKVNFIAADMPNADKFMFHVYAAMAEEEGRRISERTKAALASARARGVKLGEHARAPEKRNSSIADEFAKEIGPVIEGLRQRAGLSFREVANELNRLGVRTFRDGAWHANTAYRLHNRFRKITTRCA